MGAGLPNKSLADKDDSCGWRSKFSGAGGGCWVVGEAEKKALASMVSSRLFLYIGVF